MRRVCRHVPLVPLATKRFMRQTDQDRLPRIAEEAVLTANGVEMNLFTAVNNAMDVALKHDEKVVLFGEDVAFGGVFRCSLDLKDKHGERRVFNAPLCEQGIAGFAIGMAAVGYKPIAEIQFADYIFPAFDQIVNEAAKWRYRTGGQFDVAGLVIRAPCSAVGHGGLYHSQSVEGYFTQCPGLKVVMPSTPAEAKGLLLQCIAEPDPCLFFEPKSLYRTSIEPVNPEYFTLPLGKARTVREGKDITIVTYGAQVNVALRAATKLSEAGIECDVIDLRSLMPWDEECVFSSVNRTGRCIVTHEAPVTCGYGAEIISAITKNCFLRLEAPPERVCGLDTPFPLHEHLYLPNMHKLVEAAKALVKY